MIVAGIDEAGYGPLLGPLVVSVSVFRLPGEGPTDLWEALAPAVSRSTRTRAVPVDDSKKLFRQGKGLAHLEEGILPFLRLRRQDLPRDFRSFLQAVARRGSADAEAYLDIYPWYRGRNLPIPRGTFPGVVRRLSERLGERLEAAAVEFLGMASAPVEVREFNEQIDAFENKSRVSFAVVGRFLRRLWRQFPGESTEVIVDHQGSRTHYAPLLFETLKPRGIQIEEQTRELSRYRLSRPDRRQAGRFRVQFATECEEKHLPVALASMLSKYVRELHMALFNEYWLELQQGLKPTAGYVVDARRFLGETAALRRNLGIDERLLIRSR
ncbi:MAG: hypothetical protein O7J95_02955 [Planctomycetota bacterium]|nr:hypothetical protein [Planctomycetota bacterium]